MFPVQVFFQLSNLTRQSSTSVPSVRGRAGMRKGDVGSKIKMQCSGTFSLLLSWVGVGSARVVLACFLKHSAFHKVELLGRIADHSPSSVVSQVSLGSNLPWFYHTSVLLTGQSPLEPPS